MMVDNFCISCGTRFLLEASFCTQCGQRRNRHCVQCGAQLLEGAAFCVSCGARIARSGPAYRAPHWARAILTDTAYTRLRARMIDLSDLPRGTRNMALMGLGLLFS